LIGGKPLPDNPYVSCRTGLLSSTSISHVQEPDFFDETDLLFLLRIKLEFKKSSG
jgi:hypothetical protein